MTDIKNYISAIDGLAQDEDSILFIGDKFWYIYDLYNSYGHKANFVQTLDNKIHIELYEITHTKNILFDTNTSQFSYLYDGRLNFHEDYYIAEYTKNYFKNGGAFWYSAKRNKSNALFNYEINKVVKRISKPLGEISKLSVAVMIDGTMQGDPLVYQPRSQEEMDKYLQIVKSAVGFDEERGDIIQVENIQFDRSELETQRESISRSEQIDLGLEIGKLVVGIVFLILFFTRIIRPVINWMTTTVEVVPEVDQLTSGILTPEEEEKQRISEMASQASEIRESVAEFVNKDPKYTAGVIRKWMREKEPKSKP